MYIDKYIKIESNVSRMQNVRLPQDLALKEGVAPGDNSTNITFWRRGQEPKEWERIRSSMNPEGIELSSDVTAVKVTISKWREKVRGFLRGLFKKQEEDVLTDVVPLPSGKIIEVEQAERGGHPALLAWAKEGSQVQFDDVLVKQLFPESKGYEILSTRNDLCLMLGELKRKAVTAVATSSPSESPISAAERELQERIEQAETSFLKFGEWILPKIREHVPEGDVRNVLEFPFRAVELNRTNLLKNIYALLRSEQSSMAAERSARDWGHFFVVILDRSPLKIRRSALENLNHFFYEVVVFADPDQVAGYKPSTRTLALGEIDFNASLGMVMLHHELIHLGQDTALRAFIDSEEGWKAYHFDFELSATEQRTVLNHEAQAFGCSVELLNILLEGKLKRTPPSVTADEAYRVLGAQPHQQGLVDMLLHLAQLYFPHGMSEGTIPIPYAVELAKAYEHKGHRCFKQQGMGFTSIRADALLQERTLEIPHVHSVSYTGS